MQRPLAERSIFRYNDSMKVNTTNEALLAAAREAVSAAYDGERHTVGAAVRGKHGEEILPPCGNCRQMLADYAPECEVLLPGGQTKKAKDLLPFAYHAEF